MNDSKQPIAEQATTANKDPVALFGFPPKKHPRGVRRLYEGPDSKAYVEIKVADIVRAGADKHAKEPGQSVIWVRPDARVLLAELPVSYLEPDKHLRWPR